jgi:hypothetical protein
VRISLKVEQQLGFLLVAFASPTDALCFATNMAADMKLAPWSPDMLSHPLGEEITMRMPNTAAKPGSPAQLPVIAAPGDRAGGRVSNPGTHNLVLRRGPRVKAGFARQIAAAEVHVTTRRMAYRSKALNRASRIANLAKPGQVGTS